MKPRCRIDLLLSTLELKNRRQGIPAFCLALLLLLTLVYSFTTPATAGEPSGSWVAKVASVEGRVLGLKAGSSHWTVVRMNDTFHAGDKIWVDKLSRATVVLSNETQLRLDQNTILTFHGQSRQKKDLIELIRGVVNFFIRVPNSLDIATPFVNGTVEGTEFLVRVDAQKSEIIVFNGQVAAFNAAGRLNVGSGRAAVAHKGNPPQPMTVVHPRDAVHWALYYPRVLASAQTVPLKGSADDLVARAAALLRVGQVDAADRNLERAMAIASHHSDVYALKAVMAVVQNRKKQALALANRAVEYDAHSAAARLARSYARQALFDMQGALKSAETAVALAPQNALAKARLAELYLSKGELDRALATAKAAVAINPALARTQTVLGFAHLSQIQIDEALAAFTRAIELDQAAPLARLGQGLAEIRRGKLKPGRIDIEIAAALDPGNSLIRSYLGKAFYEEKRDKLASRQFHTAKQLDPLDPTPFLYDAIRKQSVNRPVEALHDLQKSMALNDNRAVFRSRLLLDEDLAVRGASLGRIYNELGFRQLALAEGWRSVNQEPANYSAHRFLSDSYSVLPRHEVARISELLQSQLLQPLNISPVQPQLAEASLRAGAFGPAEPSLNEFNPLFNRNRLSLLTSGVAGQNNILGDELVLSGIYDRLSFSMGQFHDETEGFRPNNDLTRNIYNLFLQTSLSYKTSLLAEGRYESQKEGDLPLRFPIEEHDNFSQNRRQDRKEKLFRIGLRHAFSPRSQLVGHYTHVWADENAHDVFGIFPIDFELDDTGDMLEAQHLWQAKSFHLTSGVGYFKHAREKTIHFSTKELTEPDIEHTNAYLYALIDYPQHFSWTLGASADFFRDDESVNRDQFNPKIGLMLRPHAGTTLRAAVFRTLKRSLAARQTIEPSQIAGFNQLFDDPNGTQAWHYGIALDQTFGADVHAGAAYSFRDLSVPQIELVTANVTDADWNEQLARAYVYWTPHPFWALGVEYLFENFDRENNFTGIEQVRNLDTHRFPLAVRFFHPNGLSAGVQATYIDQRGTFGTETADLRNDSDRFWLLDASIRYRLPRRLGFITLSGRNLLDTDFNFQDMDLAKRVIFPERVITAQITLSF